MGDDHRRLEGLIAPGSWDVSISSASPRDILSALVGASAFQYAQGGLLDTAKALGMTPYQILTVASLVQRESKPQDFDKVARVIYNRLIAPDHRRLRVRLDVNYLLDRQEVATTDADRGRETPWNTYVREGLPATPICSPSAEALAAAERPAVGDWLYFVTHRPAGHDALHQGLPTAPGEHRTREAQRCPRQRPLTRARRRCSVRR